jgi:hypothetical protein
MKTSFFTCILALASFQSHAFTDAVYATALDTVHAEVWGGALVSDQPPSGLKGSESGLLDAWASHSFTDAVSCRLYIRGTPSFATPFVEEASLGYRREGFTAKAGFLSTHLGRAELYKPFSVFNRFTRTSAVWDSYGFGFCLYGRPGGMGLGGAATINNRENGCAHVLWTAGNNTFVCNRAFVGIQTSNLDNQDNSLTVGDDFTLALRTFSAHVSAGYTAYQGYGNPTIKPGNQFEVFGEAKFAPLSRLSLCAMAFYEDYKKGYLFVSTPSTTLEYSLQTLLCGLDAQYMAMPWLGLYGGYEYQQSMNTGSHIPEIGVAVVPVADRTLIRVGWESTIIGAAHLNRIAAILWFVY